MEEKQLEILKNILKDIVYAQSTQEFSGERWMKSMFADIEALSLPDQESKPK